MSRVERDLAIIGAGPAGLYAVYYAGFRGLSSVVIDSLPQAGGQITAMYPEKPIFDVAGFPSIKGRDLVAGLMEQAMTFEPTFLLGDQATTLTHTPDERIELETSGGTTVSVRAVIIAAGIGTFTPRQLPAGEDWLGRGLSYFVPSLDAHAGKHVVIVGGGDSACDWALSLEPIAASVTLVHRREQFAAHAHTVSQLRASTVEVITSAQVTKITGDDAVSGVEITSTDGEVHTRATDGVVAALGFTANLGPMREWGLEIVDNRFIPVGTTMATVVPGVFAVGDVTEYEGKVRLIAVGFGEAATAVNNAAVFIDSSAALFPGHSSDGIPVAV